MTEKLFTGTLNHNQNKIKTNKNYSQVVVELLGQGFPEFLKGLEIGDEHLSEDEMRMCMRHKGLKLA